MQPFSPQRLFLKDFKSIGQYHDFWISVILKAPDGFHYSFLPEPVDQRQALVDAFDSLHRGLTFAKAKLKNERLLGVVSELLRMSYEFYLTDEPKKGIRALQEAEGLIWPKHRIRLELTAIAEKRAFGNAQLFKDVCPRRFDGEGSIESLGSGQRMLFDTAQSRALELIRLRTDFKSFVLVLNRREEIIEIKQTSFKKSKAEVQQLAEKGEISAAVRTEFVLLGTLIHDLEELKHPHISARAPVKHFQVERFRFFLDDPSIFPLCDDATKANVR